MMQDDPNSSKIINKNNTLARDACHAVVSDRVALRSDGSPFSLSKLFLSSTRVMASKPPNKDKGRRGGRERAPVPTMHTHQPHFAQVVSVSANGRSVTAPAHTLETTPNVPSYFEEDFQTNAAVESVDFSYDLGDTALVGEVQELGSDGIILKSRRKVYQNSVRRQPTLLI
jgi:hypothetical protein